MSHRKYIIDLFEKQLRIYQDAEGKMKYAANVAVDEVYFGGGSSKKDEDYSRKTDNSIASDSVQSTNADNENWVNMEISDDDLPF